MRFISILALSFIIQSFMVSAKANSMTLSIDTINYKGYRLNGQSLSVNTNLNKHYGYELSLQRFDSYSLNEQKHKLNVNNKIDLTNLSMGLYRQMTFDKFYIRPIIGVVHSTVNIKTTLRYQDKFKLFDDDYPIDLKYEQYSSKTALLPMYGARAGYNFTDNFDVFIGFRYQGYPVKLIGAKVRF